MNKDTIDPEQMSYLLHMVTLATRRKFDSEEGSIWQHLLSDYTYDQCHEAFTYYLKDTERYLTPSLIISLIKDFQRQRLATAELSEPPSGMKGDEYLKWLDRQREELAQPPVAPPLPQAQIKNMSPEAPKQLSS